MLLIIIQRSFLFMVRFRLFFIKTSLRREEALINIEKEGREGHCRYICRYGKIGALQFSTYRQITYKYILFLKIIIIFLCICRCLFLLRPSHRSETIRFDFVFTLAKDFHNSNCREFVINENIMVKVKSLSKKIHKTSNRKSGVIFLNLNKCFN